MLSDRRDNKPLKTPAAYKLKYGWLGEVDSLALCNAQMDLKKAFENHRKKPKHFKLPKFKSRRNRQSYSTNNQKGSVRIEDSKIKLPKVGWVKVVQHRKIEGKLNNQDGNSVNSKKAKDSNNSKKFRIRLSKIHEKVANQRRDFLQKLSYYLVATYDCICIEDLNTKMPLLRISKCRNKHQRSRQKTTLISCTAGRAGTYACGENVRRTKAQLSKKQEAPTSLGRGYFTFKTEGAYEQIRI